MYITSLHTQLRKILEDEMKLKSLCEDIVKLIPINVLYEIEIFGKTNRRMDLFLTIPNILSIVIELKTTDSNNKGYLTNKQKKM